MSNIDNLELASTKNRIRAFIIDDLAVTFVIMLMLWDQISVSGGDFTTILLLINGAFIQVVILKFIYQTFFIWYYGATLGKLVVKIRVIDFDSFGRVSLTNALLRSSGRILSEMAFYIGFFVAFYTESKQTFHDKIGKTLVVNA
ncbi:MAG: RDD family protein [Arcobacteraceae bacterium]|nr:RDD family protein [Arcobacteraceae bacterium]